MAKAKVAVPRSKSVTVEQYCRARVEVYKEMLREDRDREIKEILDSYVEYQAAIDKELQEAATRQNNLVRAGGKNFIEAKFVIVLGPKKGVTYTKKLFYGDEPMLLGRSCCKKTREGISLRHDDELSSGHGKFWADFDETQKEGAKSEDNKALVLMYEDMGSTNGSYLNTSEEALPPHPVPIRQGDILKVGQTSLKLTSVVLSPVS